MKNKVLTGKQLRYAAKHGLEIIYTEEYYNPQDSDKNYLVQAALEKTKAGYFIGYSDIDPDDYADEEPVTCDFIDGILNAYAVPGVSYDEGADPVIPFTSDLIDLDKDIQEGEVVIKVRQLKQYPDHWLEYFGSKTNLEIWLNTHMSYYNDIPFDIMLEHGPKIIDEIIARMEHGIF